MVRRPTTLVLRLLLLAPCLLLGPGARHPVASAAGTVQRLFLGDRDCGDNVSDCAFAAVTPEHRYLHVIVHDASGYDAWRFGFGPVCASGVADSAGRIPLPPNGFLEVAVPVDTGKPLCFLLRGDQGYYVTYYAAYLDDSPTADAQNLFPGYQSLGGRPALPDLDIEYIHRDPAYAYDGYPNRPRPGDEIQYTAHVSNAGGEPAAPFSYEWKLDEGTVGAGRVTEGLRPGEETTISLTQRSDGSPHSLSLVLNPGGDDGFDANNTETLQTDALSLGLWIEEGALKYFNAHQWLYCRDLPCAGSNSFADWARRQVTTWNHLLATSAYPGLAPTGVADRVLLDKITVVPDGSLPLHGFLPTNSPDLSDHTVDLEWGFVAKDVGKTYHDQWEGPFDVDWGLIHELGHARYLADLYRMDVPPTGDHLIDVTGVDGKPIFDPAHPDAASNPLRAIYVKPNLGYLYHDLAQDLMSCSCLPSYSAYTALVLNRIRGRRATCGNANPPCDLGDWFGDLPPINRLKLFDRSGQPLPDGSVVYAYYDSGQGYTGHRFDDAHRETLTVQAAEIQLDTDPFHAGADAGARGHNLLLLGVSGQAGEEFCFLEPTTLNMAYWMGYRTRATPAEYELHLGREVQNGCNLQLPPAMVNEPFATSPYVSTVDVGPVQALGGRSNVRPIAVTLRDDASPPNPMRNRVVRVRDRSGRSLASGLTDARGVARLLVPAGARAAWVEDVTDNHLTLEVTAGALPRGAVPRR